MSFSPDTEKLVNNLIQAEYKNACEKFGEKFNSLHEGYAVLLEEVEEVEDCIKRLKNEIDYIWTCIKKNKTENITYSVDDSLNIFTKNAIKELAQVGAVLMKIKNTINKVKE